MGERIAVYPGSFDPITNGHLDLVERCHQLFEKVVVAILENPVKQPTFPLEERLAAARQAVIGLPNVSVDTFHGLLVDYIHRQKARVIIRGLRAVSDFESELQMAMMNRRLDSRVETVFLMPSETYSYLSSHLVREVASLGGDVTGLVPTVVREMLSRRYGSSGKQER